MAEAESEKIVKDTLSRYYTNNDLIYWQKVTTPKYQREWLDFVATTLDSRTHLIEVKENGNSNAIPQGQFKEEQLKILTADELNKPDSHSRAWIIAKIFSGDRTKAHSDYYEHYFQIPGHWAKKSTIGLRKLRESEECFCLGQYEYGEWINITEGNGLSTRGNETLGFKQIPFIEESVDN